MKINRLIFYLIFKDYEIPHFSSYFRINLNIYTTFFNIIINIDVVLVKLFKSNAIDNEILHEKSTQHFGCVNRHAKYYENIRSSVNAQY